MNAQPRCVEFLQGINLNYPCTKCQGNLLIDSPIENESVLTWTLRNHIRFDPTFTSNAYIIKKNNGSNLFGIPSDSSNICPECPLSNIVY